MSYPLALAQCLLLLEPGEKEIKSCVFVDAINWKGTSRAHANNRGARLALYPREKQARPRLAEEKTPALFLPLLLFTLVGCI